MFSFFVFLDRVSQCSTGKPQTHINMPAPASHVRRLKKRVITFLKTGSVSYRYPRMPVNYVTKDDLELLIGDGYPDLNTTETMMEAPFMPRDPAHRQHHLPKGEYRPTAFFFRESS